MSQSIKKTEKTPTGKVKKGRTKSELKEYLKLRSREYYSTPEAKERQRLKVAEYRKNNRELINHKRRIKEKKVRFEKKMKKIWIARGLIK
jgi:hypothetical protein